MKYNFSPKITVLEDHEVTDAEDRFKIFTSLKEYMGSLVKVKNLLTNIDINTANQFLIAYYFNNVYKMLFNDLQKSALTSTLAVSKNIIVSVDPCTLFENMIVEGSHINIRPVYPVEITVCCNENNFYKRLLKDLIGR